MAEPKHAERTDAAEDARPEDDVEMTFFEHLGELRTRLIRALLAIVPGLVIGWYFHEELMRGELEDSQAALATAR